MAILVPNTFQKIIMAARLTLTLVVIILPEIAWLMPEPMMSSFPVVDPTVVVRRMLGALFQSMTRPDHTIMVQVHHMKSRMFHHTREIIMKVETVTTSPAIVVATLRTTAIGILLGLETYPLYYVFKYRYNHFMSFKRLPSLALIHLEFSSGFITMALEHQALPLIWKTIRRVVIIFNPLDGGH